MDDLAWVDPIGDVYQLTEGPDIDVEYGIDGRLMPTSTLTEEPFVEADGSQLLDVRIPPRDVVLRAWPRGTDEHDFRLTIEKYGYAFNPKRGIGRLRSTRPDGTQRDLNCVAKFIPSAETLQNGVESNTLLSVIQFRALDPFWYDTADVPFDPWTTGSSARGWFPWTFPITLANSSVFVQPVVDNYGQYDAWPLWIITGPGSDLVIRNTTTDAWFALDYTLDVGEVVTIDARQPGKKFVRSSTGQNLLPKFDGDFWAFVEGLNDVTIEFGALTPASSVQLYLKHRYNAP